MIDTRPADSQDVVLVADIVARGFYDDPVMAWVFREPDLRLAQLRFAFEGAAEAYIAEGVIHLLEDSCASLWRSPGFDHLKPFERRRRPLSEEDMAVAATYTAEIQDRFAILSATLTEAHPHQPHWYLGVLSTVPERQSQGLGARTMAPTLHMCDSDGIPAYLESSNPRNIPFYERQGFVLTGELHLPDGPSLFPMWRDPRPPRSRDRDLDAPQLRDRDPDAPKLRDRDPNAPEVRNPSA